VSSPTGTLNLVLAALGGEGGGVLTDWIIEVARREGWLCQSTSLAGVAQRTGATIYYLEMYPRASVPEGAAPVMSLFPAPGDIDIAIASEIAEAGRMVQRGFVTPDRTTVIASDHRVYGITEKINLGDGVVDADVLRDIVGRCAQDFIHFDMQALASEQETVISAVLFGALAGTKVLPFSRQTFVDVIGASGKAVERNTRAFDAAYERAAAGPAATVETFEPPAAAVDAARSPQPRAETAAGARLLQRIEGFPESCREVLGQGVLKLVDYQDHAYAAQYLDSVSTLHAALPADESAGELLREFARYLALLMAFEDIPRVAQLKTRPQRMDKVRREVRAEDGQLLHVTEFFRPRVEEMLGMLPAGIGRRAVASPTLHRLLRPLTGGRRLRTDSVSVFAVLRVLAGLRRWRRGTLAFANAQAITARWETQVLGAARRGDLALAAELAECGRLVKGYGDTHARTSAQLLAILDRVAGDTALAAPQVAELREAAFADDENKAFSQALAALSAADAPPEYQYQSA
jgi:indolepyruvate ferredoxin oxidoreductase beta subunit